MRRKILSTSIRSGRTRLHLDSRQQLARRIMTKLQADVLLKPQLLIEEAVTLSGLSTALFKSAQIQLYQINGLFSAAWFGCNPSSGFSAVKCCFLGRIHRKRRRRRRRGCSFCGCSRLAQVICGAEAAQVCWQVGLCRWDGSLGKSWRRSGSAQVSSWMERTPPSPQKDIWVPLKCCYWTRGIIKSSVRLVSPVEPTNCVLDGSSQDSAAEIRLIWPDSSVGILESPDKLCAFFVLCIIWAVFQQWSVWTFFKSPCQFHHSLCGLFTWLCPTLRLCRPSKLIFFDCRLSWWVLGRWDLLAGSSLLIRPHFPSHDVCWRLMLIPIMLK